MTDETTNLDQEYDPDRADEIPAPQFASDHIGTLIGAYRVNSAEEAAAIEERFGQSYERFNEAFVKDNSFYPACWLVVSEAKNVFADEEGGRRPARFSQLIRLQGKGGRWLGEGQGPDIYAKRFRELGLSASFLAVERDDTAVGKTFHFVEKEVELPSRRRRRQAFTKSFSLWPEQVITEEVPDLSGHDDGDEVTIAGIETTVRVFTRDAGAEGIESVEEGPPVNTEDAVSVLVAALNGKTPGDMASVVVGEAALKNVDELFGVTLLTAAVDESLATILLEKELMTLVDGKLLAAQPVEA